MLEALLLSALTLGQTFDVKPGFSVKAAPVAQAKDEYPDYSEAYTQALKLNKPLVVYVGYPVLKPLDGEWLAAHVDHLRGYKTPSVVVAVPRDGELYYRADFDEAPSAATIRRVIGKGVERMSAAPFRGQPLSADDNQSSRSGWVWSDADIPEYMEPYHRSRFTQRIAVTNGRDTITPVDRSSLEEKWRVPGGMVGIKGWASRLYSWAPQRRWVGNIGVLNSFGYIQQNRGWKAEYEVGSEFLDVLENTSSGEVFEVRKAVKTADGWQRFVTYRAPEHRPHGYAGPRGLDCRGCHEGPDRPGTGGYAAGLISGADTIFSVPVPELEQP